MADKSQTVPGVLIGLSKQDNVHMGAFPCGFWTSCGQYRTSVICDLWCMSPNLGMFSLIYVCVHTWFIRLLILYCIVSLNPWALQQFIAHTCRLDCTAHYMSTLTFFPHCWGVHWISLQCGYLLYCTVHKTINHLEPWGATKITLRCMDIKCHR